MPRFYVIADWRVIPERDRIFSTMNDTTFDPWRTVLLEKDPGLPHPTETMLDATVKLVDSSTDHSTLDVNVQQPVILLVTDAYSAGWHAYPLDGSIQNVYEVIPANYAFQAIPLSPGHHHLRLETAVMY